MVGSSEYKERLHGVKIPSTDPRDYHLGEARGFAEHPGQPPCDFDE
jgi:hypothetical protein